MGRKRTANAKREPNGRLSRALAGARKMDAFDREQQDTLSVGLEARQRLFGLRPEQSRDQMAGSFIGRMCIGGEISRAQFDAATQWCEDSRNYSIALSSPRQPGAIDLNATKGGNGDYDPVSFKRHSIAKYEAAQKAVQEAQNDLRGSANLFGALYHLVIRDMETFHLIPDAKIALNALARHYGLDGRGKVFAIVKQTLDHDRKSA